MRKIAAAASGWKSWPQGWDVPHVICAACFWKNIMLRQFSICRRVVCCWLKFADRYFPHRAGDSNGGRLRQPQENERLCSRNSITFLQAPLRKGTPEKEHNAGALALALGYRPPYRWKEMLDFWRDGLLRVWKKVDGETYSRVARMENREGKNMRGLDSDHASPE